MHNIPSGDSDRPVIVSLWPVSSWTGLWFGPIVFFDPSLFVFLRSHTLTTLSIPPLIIWSLLSPNVTEVTWYVEVRLNTAPLNKMWIWSVFLFISENLPLKPNFYWSVSPDIRVLPMASVPNFDWAVVGSTSNQWSSSRRTRTTGIYISCMPF